MNPYNRVEVTDRDGWRREFSLARQLVHVGSDPRNDVVLDTVRGSGVSPHHLQILAIGGRPGLRAVNLGDSDVVVDGVQPRSIGPRGALEIGDGDSVHLGEFTLVFRLAGAAPPVAAAAPAVTMGTQGAVTPPQAAATAAPPAAATAPTRSQPAVPPAGADTGAERRSAGIGARLSMSTTALAPNVPLDATIAVRNLGNEPGVQFRLEVQGLEPDCYEVGPGPILFPGVEKSVFLRLYHPQRPEPQAGRHTVQVRVSAPDAYPSESVIVSHEIHILPYYRHSLHLASVE